jgi:alanyl-tRNA synthetase
MVSMGSFSRELCGGTHLENTRDVGPFEITAEEGVSAGMRRIVAFTGEVAKDHAQHTRAVLRQAASSLGVDLLEVPAAVRQLAQTVRDLKKQLATGAKAGTQEAIARTARAGEPVAPDYAAVKSALRDAARLLNVSAFDVARRITALLAEVEDLGTRSAQLARSGHWSADALLEKADSCGGTRVVVAELPGANPNVMRQLIDQLRKKTPSVAVLLATSAGEEKVVLVSGVSRDLVERGVSAGDWVRQVAPLVGGGGGGKPDMAQAGGKDPARLPEAMDAAKKVIREMLTR